VNDPLELLLKLTVPVGGTLGVPWSATVAVQAVI
jgi:hypothetical protein